MIRGITCGALAFTLVIGMSGCASIFNGRDQDIYVETSPSVAVCSINDQAFSTPTTVRLKRAYNYTIVCKKDGYLPTERFIAGRVSGWIFGNLLFIGLIVDFNNGSAFNLLPERISMALNPSPNAAPPAPTPAETDADNLGIAKSGPAPRLYKVLVSLERSKAVDLMKEVSPKLRKELTDHLIATKGDSTASSWKFLVSPKLPESEADIVRWYLSTYSDYKPIASKDAIQVIQP